MKPFDVSDKLQLSVSGFKLALHVFGAFDLLVQVPLAINSFVFSACLPRLVLAPQGFPDLTFSKIYSHSMVAGGLLVIS